MPLNAFKFQGALRRLRGFKLSRRLKPSRRLKAPQGVTRFLRPRNALRRLKFSRHLKAP